jgi:RNA polymerase sigma-70 factor (ECF subfamily)
LNLLLNYPKIGPRFTAILLYINSHHTDEELLRQLREGSKDAFEAIFNRYWNSLYRIAYARLKSHEDAEEIVQELLASLWKKRSELLISNLDQYLFVSVKRRVISAIRQRITHEKYWEYYKHFLPEGTTITDEVVEYNDLHTAIEKAMQHLPEKSQQVFRLNRLQGLSIAEIAENLKMPRRTIEYHLTRSLRELRLHLKDFILFVSICFFS